MMYVPFNLSKPQIGTIDETNSFFNAGDGAGNGAGLSKIFVNTPVTDFTDDLVDGGTALGELYFKVQLFAPDCATANTAAAVKFDAGVPYGADNLSHGTAQIIVPIDIGVWSTTAHDVTSKLSFCLRVEKKINSQAGEEVIVGKDYVFTIEPDTTTFSYTGTDEIAALDTTPTTVTETSPGTTLSATTDLAPLNVGDTLSVRYLTGYKGAS